MTFLKANPTMSLLFRCLQQQFSHFLNRRFSHPPLKSAGAQQDPSQSDSRSVFSTWAKYYWAPASVILTITPNHSKACGQLETDCIKSPNSLPLPRFTPLQNHEGVPPTKGVQFIFPLLEPQRTRN